MSLCRSDLVSSGLSTPRFSFALQDPSTVINAAVSTTHFFDEIFTPLYLSFPPSLLKQVLRLALSNYLVCLGLKEFII